MTHIFELDKSGLTLVEKTGYLIVKETSKSLKEGDTIVLQSGNEEEVKTLKHISEKEAAGLKPNFRILTLKDNISQL